MWCGSGVGFGDGARAGVSCVVPSVAVDDVDDACMDGSVSDVIHTGSNSVFRASPSIMIVHVLVCMHCRIHV